MHYYTIIGIFMITVFVGSHSAPTAGGDKYTNKYDNINLNEILNNDRLLKNYVNCLLDKGKCTPDGKELKSHVAEAIQNDCAKCTEKQKEGGERVIRFLYENRKEMFNELTSKYDPTGEYKKKYESKLKN